MELVGAFIFILLIVAGCSTPNVNPATPKPGTGYVDVYTDTDLDISWEVKRADPRSAQLHTVFSDLDPIEGNVLRLATPPGTHKFQVWIMNCVTEGPRVLDVAVEAGKITPVRVTLDLLGPVSVDRKDYAFRGSAKGYGHGTKIITDKNQAYRIGAVAGAPVNYQPKERMTYFSTNAK
jgi:hypothetical protein